MCKQLSADNSHHTLELSGIDHGTVVGVKQDFPGIFMHIICLHRMVQKKIRSVGVNALLMTEIRGE